MNKLLTFFWTVSALALLACGGEDSSGNGPGSESVESSAEQTFASSSSVAENAVNGPVTAESSSALDNTIPESNGSLEPASSAQSSENKSEDAECVESVNAQITLTSVEHINMSCSAATNGWTVYNTDTQILSTCDGARWNDEVVVLCKHEEEPVQEVSVTYGTLTDARDGQTYKTVVIGEKEWMAENLNFYKSTDGSIVMDSSFCYDDNPANCEKYGRLYQEFDAAEACPEGWSMPTEIDWFDFTRVLKNEFPDKNLNEVTRATSGWDDEWKSNNASGFSAVAAGMRNSEGDYVDEEYRAYFWGDKGMVYYAWTLGWLSEFTAGSRIYAYYAYSLRCVKN